MLLRNESGVGKLNHGMQDREHLSTIRLRNGFRRCTLHYNQRSEYSSLLRASER